MYPSMYCAFKCLYGSRNIYTHPNWPIGLHADFTFTLWVGFEVGDTTTIFRCHS